MPTLTRTSKSLLILLVLLAASEFVVRGPVRFLRTAEFSGTNKRLARGTLLLILPFLVPGGSALTQFQASGRIPEVISHSWYWVGIVMPHQIWFLILLSLLLLRGMAVGDRAKVRLQPTRLQQTRGESAGA